MAADDSYATLAPSSARLPNDNPAFQKCLSLFQMLSNGFQPIYVFRFDDKSGEIFILAGVNEGIEIVVFRNGLWEFTDEQTEY